MKNIGLIGFGKIGQALAAQILESNFSVIAVDINPELQASLSANQYKSTEPDVAPIIVDAFKDKRLSVTTEFEEISKCQAVIVCIPLLLDQSQQAKVTIDFEPFDNCFMNIAEHVHNKMLISLDTTVPVGTSRNRVQSIFAMAGKTHEKDYLLVFSPERIKSGSMLKQLTTIPKIVGGLSKEALESGLDLYRQFIPEKLVEPVTSIEVAEMIKLSGMIYRDVNIALVNQLAQYCDAAHLDIQEVIANANTDKESNLLLPGIGVGGHCTPVYPHFMMDNFTNKNLTFDLAINSRKINDSMPSYVANSICKEFAVQSALILGLAFRPNVKEDTCSPTYQLYRALTACGITTFVCDPLYSAKELENKGLASVVDMYARQFDAIFLVTAHEEFLSIDFGSLHRKGCQVFVDGRNVYDPERVYRAGLAYRGIGTGFRNLVHSAAVSH